MGTVKPGLDDHVADREAAHEIHYVSQIPQILANYTRTTLVSQRGATN